MLGAIHPWGRPVRPYRSKTLDFRVAKASWEQHDYRALRKSIFVDEQGVFQESDWDEIDDSSLPIVALSVQAGMATEVVGVVRIYQAGEHFQGESSTSIWVGGRLGVCPAYRRHGVVGEGLIRAAVSTAHGLGATRFLATVQQANVRYFERRHFRPLRPIEVAGQPHFLMEASLEAYPVVLEAA